MTNSPVNCAIATARYVYHFNSANVLTHAENDLESRLLSALKHYYGASILTTEATVMDGTFATTKQQTVYRMRHMACHADFIIDDKNVGWVLAVVDVEN